jgi:serine/threonine protein kinase
VSESSDPDAASAELSQTGEIDEAYCAACNQSFTIDAQFCPNDGAKLIKLKARPDTLIGRVFDNRYEVRAPLGHGGMGTVYRGWQLSVDREIAIKVIHPKLSGDRNIAKRFLREARLASRLSQANIVGVYEFGQTEDGILYLAMELLRGRPLSKDLEAQRPLPMKRIKSIGMQMCDALDAAHSQGIIHRDLKPGNIVILDEPVGRDLIKILDFGLAKSLVQDNTSLVTKTDAILGTPLYMPPEQILGKASDQTADLYSLGCILYQLATGRPPYVGENVNVVLASHVRDPIPEVGDNVPADLKALIQGLMKKEPADRFQKARDVHTAIEALADDPDSILTTRAYNSPPPPGVRSDVIRSVTAPSMLGLAVTASTPVPGPGPVTNPSLDRPPVTRRWVLPVAALALLGGGAVVAFKLTSTDPGTPATGQSGSAPVQSDAERASQDLTVVAADAAVDPDTQVAASPDAKAVSPDARRSTNTVRQNPPPPRRDAGVVAARPDAAIAVPPVIDPLLPRDAGVVKPKPDIDLVPPPPKPKPGNKS